MEYSVKINGQMASSPDSGDKETSGNVSSLSNPFIPNGISHSYQLDQPISNFKGFWVVSFNLVQFLKVHFVSKQCRT